MTDVELICKAFEQLKDGCKKVEISNNDVTVTAYKIGTNVLRIDIKSGS